MFIYHIDRFTGDITEKPAPTEIWAKLMLTNRPNKKDQQSGYVTKTELDKLIAGGEIKVEGDYDPVADINKAEPKAEEPKELPKICPDEPMQDKVIEDVVEKTNQASEIVEKVAEVKPKKTRKRKTTKK